MGKLIKCCMCPTTLDPDNFTYISLTINNPDDIVGKLGTSTWPGGMLTDRISKTAKHDLCSPGCLLLLASKAVSGQADFSDHRS